MPDSPPQPPPSPPSQPPQDPPSDSQQSQNPNPNPQTQPQEHQQTQPTLPDQQQQQQPDDLDPEPEPETMDLTLSPEPLTKPSKGSTVRRTKRKKGTKNRMAHAALERKLHQLSLGFKPIPFVPSKSLDFAKHEVFLKKLGLWDFAHIEFDRNIRVDLVMKLIVDYNVKIRGSYVNGVKIGVSRADLARALKLPSKKGDCDVESFSKEFLSFLDVFVSKWMLLHDDPWATPTDIVNYVNLIKEGCPHKVDWAGMIWCMMEKELGMKTGLKECYYASHLQQLVKVQKEELLSEGNEVTGVESLKETVALDDDDEDEDDGGDVKMVDVEESGSVGEKVDEEMGVEVKVGLDSVGEVENVGGVEEVEKDGDCHDVDDGEKVEDAEKEEVEDVEKEKIEDVDKEKVEDVDKEEVENVEKEKVEDVEKDKVEDVEKDKVEEVEDVNNEKEENDIVKFEDLSKDKEEHDIEKVEDADKEEYEDAIDDSDIVDESKKMEVVEPADVVENVDNVENMVEEIKDEEMTDFGNYKGEQLGQGQGQWLFDGNIEAKQFLQPCSMTGVNASTTFEDVDEDEEDDDIEEDEHIEGFKIMQKGAMDGMTSSNLMQGFGTGQIPFPSNELGGQSSLELMTSRADNNMMLAEPSMFNHSVKREIDHDDDISHQVMNDNKRMRVDGTWDNKVPDFDVCIAQLQQWAEKAKMSHAAATQDAYQQFSMTQNFYSEQLAIKENEITQWRYKCEEINSRKQGEIDRLNRELYLMSSVIDGYRKALKQTQRTFGEYRRRCQVPDEPIYKDAGPGGVVKSVMELERERLKKEEEDRRTRIIIEQMFVNFVTDFQVKCTDKILEKVDYQHSRLANVVKEVELLKDSYIKQKKPANAQNDPEAPSE